MALSTRIAVVRRTVALPWTLEERKFARSRAARLLIGIMIGAVLSAGVEIMQTAATHHARQIIMPTWLPRAAAGLQTRTIATLAVAATLLSGLPVFISTRKFFRSWWSGLHSLLVPAGTVFAWTLLGGTPAELKTSVVVVAILFVFEVLRWRVDYSHLRVSLPAFQVGGGANAEVLWRNNKGDDAIRHANEDLIGRTAILEMLARCALQERMAIIALKGAYGDGKTSVLNLLEQPLSTRALVVPFKSWLPGSEESLARALLRDISLTVNKHLYVPDLRRRAFAFLRLIAGSARQLGGVREFIPANTQADEFRALASTLKRIPRPVIVLLDELDRMEAAEISTLFKLLRGASGLPNLTFICSFSEKDLQRIIGGQAGDSEDYLEKFFPASVRLPEPSQDLLGRNLCERLISCLSDQNALSGADEHKGFREDFDKIWNDCLHVVVRNLRRAGRLAVEVEMAHAPISGEVEPLDIVLLESLRSAFPEIYEIVRRNGDKLTDMQAVDVFDVHEELRKKFVQELELSSASKPAAHHILGWLFPDYDSKRHWGYQRSSERTKRRIWNPDRFQVYFRAAVPGEVFSEAETQQIMEALNRSSDAEAARRVLQQKFTSLANVPAKRADFLSRVRFRVAELPLERLADVAIAVCQMASEFRYDILWGFSESGDALQIVLTACKRMSELEKCGFIRSAILAASDDTFAYRLLKIIVDPENRVESLAELQSLSASGRQSFVDRMRDRYAQERTPSLEYTDHQAFREWMELAKEDIPLVGRFFQSFVGQSSKRLAQAAKIVFPEGFWTSDPQAMVERFLPLNVMREILLNNPGEDLTVKESAELKRMADFVIDRKYVAEPGGGFVRLPDDGPP